MSWLRRDDHQTEHRYTEDRLSAYLDGELTERERTAVEQHLESCRDCRLSLETLRQTVRWTRGLQPVPVPRVFTIQPSAQPARAARPVLALPVMRAATAVVALLFVVALAGSFVLPGRTPEMAAAPVALLEKQMVEDADGERDVVTEEGMMALEVTMAPPSEPAAGGVTEPETGAVPVAKEAPRGEAAAATAAPAGMGGVGAGEPGETARTIVTVVVQETANLQLAAPAPTMPEPTMSPDLAISAAEPMSTMVEHLAFTDTLTPTVTSTASATLTATAGLADGAPEVSATRAAVMSTALPTATVWPTVEPLPSATATSVPAVEALPVEQPLPTEVPAAAEEATWATEQAGAPQPTIIAAAPEQPEDDEADHAAEEQVERRGFAVEQIQPWLGVIQIVLGGLLIVLAATTIILGARLRRGG